MSDGAESTSYTEAVQERMKRIMDKFMSIVREVGDIAGDSWSRSLKSDILIFHLLENIHLFFLLKNVKGN